MTTYIIKAVHIRNRELVALKAAKTSEDFSLFFPPQEFSRQEMIDMIWRKDVFYKWYQDGKRVKIYLKVAVNLGIEQFDDVIRY